MEVVGDVLRDGQGKLNLSIMNIELATDLGINLRILGREEEAITILEAAAPYDDPYKETGAETIRARLLLGDVDGAMEILESPTGLLSFHRIQQEVSHDHLGLYGGLGESPAWLAMARVKESELSALVDRLRKELPSLMDATVGL